MYVNEVNSQIIVDDIILDDYISIQERTDIIYDRHQNMFVDFSRTLCDQPIFDKIMSYADVNNSTNSYFMQVKLKLDNVETKKSWIERYMAKLNKSVTKTSAVRAYNRMMANIYCTLANIYLTSSLLKDSFAIDDESSISNGIRSLANKSIPFSPGSTVLIEKYIATKLFVYNVNLHSVQLQLNRLHSAGKLCYMYWCTVY
jgi:hypothetical protein